MWTPLRLRTLAFAVYAAVSLLPAVPTSGVEAATSTGPPQPYLSTIGRAADLPPLQHVTVAMVDTGVDGDHPDLAGRIVAARRFGGGQALYPGSPHGTAVAGLIGAIDGNGVGIDGIAPNARLLVADVAQSNTDTSYAPWAIARAIRWAADRHARVINLSLAGLGPEPAYEDAVEYALARGALVVAAAGNCFDENFARCTPWGSDQAPAWLPHVLTVGATTAAGTPAPFSIPSARWVDVAAPGQLVTTLWPTRNNPYFATPDCAFLGTTSCYSTGASGARWGPTGTSFATAMVSAAAAILFGADPRLQPEQVAALLEATATPIADPRHQAGAGLIDIGAALARVEHGLVPTADYGEPNDRPADAARLPSGGVINATLDWRDDPADFYRLRLRRGDEVRVGSDGHARGTVDVTASTCNTARASMPLRRAVRFVARCSGIYLLRIAADAGTRDTYRLVTQRRRS